MPLPLFNHRVTTKVRRAGHVTQGASGARKQGAGADFFARHVASCKIICRLVRRGDEQGDRARLAAYFS